MIGYIQEGSISEIVTKLMPLMKNTNLRENFVRLILEMNPEYKSVHVRTLDYLFITLHLLFFYFVV